VTTYSIRRYLLLFLMAGMSLNRHALQASENEDPFFKDGQKLVEVADIAIVPTEQEYTINLGAHRTSQRVKFEIGLVNRTSQPLSITGLSSSCGCLLGYVPNISIPNEGRTSIRAIMVLNSYPSTASRVLTVRTGEAPGDVVLVRIVASTHLPFGFAPRKLKVEKASDAPHPVTFILTEDESEDIELASLKVKSLTGYLTGLAMSQEKDGAWNVKGTLKERLTLAGHCVEGY
jgi:hypothetical protein